MAEEIFNRNHVMIPTYMIKGIDEQIIKDVDEEIAEELENHGIETSLQRRYELIFQDYHELKQEYHPMDNCLTLEEAKIRYLSELIEKAEEITRINNGAILFKSRNIFVSCWPEFIRSDIIGLWVYIVHENFLNPLKQGKELNRYDIDYIDIIKKSLGSIAEKNTSYFDNFTNFVKDLEDGKEPDEDDENLNRFSSYIQEREMEKRMKERDMKIEQLEAGFNSLTNRFNDMNEVINKFLNKSLDEKPQSSDDLNKKYSVMIPEHEPHLYLKP